MRPTDVDRCGTNSGYSIHYQQGEEPCAACREAHRQYAAAYRDGKRIIEPTWTHPFEPVPWMEDAACKGTDTDLFFPEGPGSHPSEARAICARCPVREQCLTFALDWNITHGVWGGLAPKQRRPLRVGWRIAS